MELNEKKNNKTVKNQRICFLLFEKKKTNDKKTNVNEKKTTLANLVDLFVSITSQ